MPTKSGGSTWFSIPIGIAFSILGYWLGIQLSLIPNLQIFKLLNASGMLFDAAGILLLSRLISANQSYKKFITDNLTPQIINLFAGIPTGIASATLFSTSTPSLQVLKDSIFPLQLYLAISTFVFVVMYVKKKPIPARTRDKIISLIGGFLLFSGLSMQLLAAFIDLHIE